ncbi:MAG: response regulator transcription factor [Cyclobacteriaceae bacterium]|nr:response regulator transcription factor [Cyclobacteriaceae bacterium]
MKRILLIEDDPTLSRNIKEAFTGDELLVETAFDSVIAEKLLRKEMYDCVILDINLSGKNGFELCQSFRQYNVVTPVLMLTAFGELEDKVQGFNSGADDYLTKPFYMRELLLRVNALIKRNERKVQAMQENKSVMADDIVIHLATKTVTRQGVEVMLTPREFQVLLKLIDKKGELVSKKELIKEVWGTAIDANTNTIEVYINFLRNKIDKPFGKNSIKTKVGFGYYFDAT